MPGLQRGFQYSQSYVDRSYLKTTLKWFVFAYLYLATLNVGGIWGTFRTYISKLRRMLQKKKKFQEKDTDWNDVTVDSSCGHSDNRDAESLCVCVRESCGGHKAM